MLHRRGNTLEVPNPELLKLEEGAEKSSRTVGNDDCIRLRDPLESCREVRGLADNATLLSFARAYQVAHHNEPRRDADTHLQGHTGRRRELRHRMRQFIRVEGARDPIFDSHAPSGPRVSWQRKRDPKDARPEPPPKDRLRAGPSLPVNK